MKKVLSTLLTLSLLLTACGGTGNQQTSDDSVNEPQNTLDTAPDTSHTLEDSIYTAASGIPATQTVMRVNDNEVPAAMYLYWAMSNADNLLYQLQLYNIYYGLYGDVFNEDGTIQWDTALSEDFTLIDQIAQQTRSSVEFYAAVENMAAELGVTLTEEDRTAMAEQRATVAESYREQLLETDASAETMTAEELIDKYLTMIGLDETLYERISSVYYLFSSLQELVVTEGSPLYLEDTDCNEYGYYADHILISTVDSTTNESLSEEEIEEKRALAEDIVRRLEDSNDPITLFGNLADEYSEDPGRATNPTGYIFTPGTMVAAFEDATESLSYGEISGIVESNYGYHIILRKDMTEGLSLYPEEKEQFAQEHLLSLLDVALSQSDVIYDDVLTDFDYGAFYDTYTALVNDISGANQSDGESQETTAGESDTGDTEDSAETASKNDGETE